MMSARVKIRDEKEILWTREICSEFRLAPTTKYFDLKDQY